MNRIVILLLVLLSLVSSSSASSFIDFEDMAYNGYDGMIIYQSYFEVPLNFNVTFDNYTEGALGTVTCSSCNPSPYSGSWAAANPDYSNTELTFLHNINNFSVYFAVPIVSIGTTLTINAYDINNNLISSTSNTNALNTYQQITITGNNIKTIWLNHSTTANKIVYDDITFIEGESPTQAQCTFIDFSACSFYDLGCYFRVLLNFLYYAPGCYFTMLMDALYGMIYSIVSIPVGLITALFSGFMLCFGDLIGMITDITSLGATITGFVTNTIGLLFPSTWTLLLVLGIGIVITLRIYFFLKDISIAGFKI